MFKTDMSAHFAMERYKYMDFYNAIWTLSIIKNEDKYIFSNLIDSYLKIIAKNPLFLFKYGVD